MSFSFRYFDVEDLISEYTKVSVKFLQPCYNVDTVINGGKKDDNNETRIKKNHKCEVPLFIARDLMRRKSLKFYVPEYFLLSYAEVFKAGAHVLNLNKFCSHFYILGMKLSELLMVNYPEKSYSILFLLIEVFTSRLLQIIPVAQTCSRNHSTELLYKCDLTEHAIFNEINSFREFLGGFFSIVSKLPVKKTYRLI